MKQLHTFQMSKHGHADLCLLVTDLSQGALHNSRRTTASTVAPLLHNTALHLALCTEGTGGGEISSRALSNIMQTVVPKASTAAPAMDRVINRPLFHLTAHAGG